MELWPSGLGLVFVLIVDYSSSIRRTYGGSRYVHKRVCVVIMCVCVYPEMYL